MKAEASTTYVTEAYLDKKIEQIEHKSKRIKLTWDGQVTRKVNLPKNYKKFPYILESFPNSFYEKKFRWEFTVGTPRNYQDAAKIYSYRKDDLIAEWADAWLPTLATNLKCRLNYNYLSTDFNKWSRTLVETYGDSEVEMRRCKDYRKLAKANKTKIKSSKIVIEPSTMYYHFGTYYVRCYVRFRVDAKAVPKADTNDQNNLLF